MSIFERLESEVRSYCRSWPAVFARARGSHLWDEDGHEYLDFFSGAGALNYGHNHPAIKGALLEYLSGDVGAFSTPARLRAARALAAAEARRAHRSHSRRDPAREPRARRRHVVGGGAVAAVDGLRQPPQQRQLAVDHSQSGLDPWPRQIPPGLRHLERRSHLVPAPRGDREAVHAVPPQSTPPHGQVENDRRRCATELIGERRQSSCFPV